jgi:ADP-ribose pyrophosphatase YjhB (NUDIX family)
MTYIPSGEDEIRFLKSYDPTKYQQPGFAADTALFAVGENALQILLIKRGGYPYKGCWALPGGFVDIDEDITVAADRELMEETGLSGLYLEQVFTWGRPDRDPRYRTITASHVAMADASALKPVAGDDAAEAGWFTLLDYTVEETGGETRISYTLRGCEDMHPVVAFPAGQMQKIYPIDSAGLAFDHAESIAYSYEYLKKRAQEGFLDLAFDDKVVKARARELLLGK